MISYTVKEALQRGEERLAAVDQDAAADAAWLLCRVLDCPRAALSFMPELSADAYGRYEALLQRRISGEPLQYILGDQPFLGYSIACDPRALIPRPETEELCLEALELIKGKTAPTIVDLGTGTGAIAIALKKRRPDALVTAVDISAAALELAAQNAATLHADVELILGNMFEPLTGRRFDLIISNPPYLSAADMNELQPEVRAEPSMALFGGEDGLDFYRIIAEKATLYLNPHGVCALEIGAAQGGAVAGLFGKEFDVTIKKDMNGLERIATAVLR